jgi:predicted lipase
VISAVRNLIASNPSATLVITGHSLGGALATFAALDIKRKLNPSNRVLFYTFGSPRLGNQIFTDYVMNLYPGQYNRVTHYTDMVVQVPPRQMGFNHAGNEVWYYNSNDMNYKICENNPGSSESMSCANSYIFTTGIDAHLNYLGRPISGMCT